MVVNLFIKEPDWKGESGSDTDSAERIRSLLTQLESVIWSLVTAGGRSEARLWLCNTISGITSLTPHQQRHLFLKLLTTAPTKRGLASQLLQMMFDKSPRKAGSVLAKRSYVLDKFFQGNPMRILQWFSNFGDGSGSRHKKGAKALSQFAFVNRDICWEELEWKGKHGQSPAVVATKPHYFLDLDIQRTVENFLENVPEFWSSSEFAESLKDGDILLVDTKYFVEFFVDLMYKKDSRDVWEVIKEFLMEEFFSSLCNHLLMTLEEQEFCTFLELLRECLNPRMEPNGFGNSSHWLEFLLSKCSFSESIDRLLLLNAVINQGRQLLRLVHDEEFQEEQAKVKDIVSQICAISSSANGLVHMLNECFKMKTIEAIKFLGVQSWALHFALSEECQTPDLWECLFSYNGISFQNSDKYALLHQDGSSEENEFEFYDRASIKRKHMKQKKRRKRKRRNFDDNESYDYELLDFDTSNHKLDLQARTRSWLLSTDGFSASWTNADLPEHLSKFCFATWMKWTFAKCSEDQAICGKF